jgi:acetyl-CoA carboxylase biotin carboxyl carrier protein
MDIAEIRKLIRVMRDNGILELEIQDRRGKVRLVRENGAQAAPLAPRIDTLEPSRTRERVVTAPMVGTFYRGSGPGTPPFVEPGGRVDRGQVLCAIEAMKMVNEIAAEVAGLVLRILVEDGTPVEYGTPLMVLEPA